MNRDDQLCEQVADAYMNSLPDAGGRKLAQAGPHAGRLGDALKEIAKKARELGQPVPWGKMFALMAQVVLMLTSGSGDWAGMIAQILALFFPTPTPPVNVPGG